MMIKIVILLILIGGVFMFFRSISKNARKRYEAQPTFEEYKKQHPSSVVNGNVLCSSCGSRDIFMKKLSQDRNIFENIHVCKSCGKSLYRTTTEI